MSRILLLEKELPHEQHYPSDDDVSSVNQHFLLHVIYFSNFSKDIAISKRGEENLVGFIEEKNQSCILTNGKKFKVRRASGTGIVKEKSPGKRVERKKLGAERFYHFGFHLHEKLN